MKIYPVFCLLTISFSASFSKESYNILLGIPVTSKSIHHLFSSLGYALADAGHSVTLFTSFNPTKNHANMTHFQPDDFSKLIAVKRENILYNRSSFAFLQWVIRTSVEVVDPLWTNEEVWKLYERRNEFDAIITPSYSNEVIFPFLQGYKGIFMMVCTPGVEYYSVARSGHWLPPSVVPGILLPFDEYMNFWERSANLVNLLITQNLIDKIPKYLMKKELLKYHSDLQDLANYYERSSLTLINGHFALDGPVPLLPNQVEVGTINAEKPKPLPKDLEDFVQGSGEAGVIYFSLGSFILGREIPTNIKEILIETFRRLPQRIIWKYEEKDLDFPPNVILRKWLPQQDILGHPKTKIFISHCGNLGTQEAKFHGVPILAVPIAFDQPRNAARLVRKGYGVIVKWNEITVEKLLEAVHTLTTDSSYYDRMKNVSKILQDQKESPAERAVWWVEYVIRHKGAPHLQYAGQRLHPLQYIMVDVVAFWSVVLCFLLVTFIWSCKRIWRKCFELSKIKRD